jgi:hypothetical protein
MAFRPASSSATADDMMAVELSLDYWRGGNTRSWARIAVLLRVALDYHRTRAEIF